MVQLIEAIRPSGKTGALAFAFDAALVLCASLLLSFFAQCAIPLPFTPVPITLQTCAIHLICYSLGSKRAFLAVLTYLIQGCLGLPVFAGGSFGLSVLFGLRGGYLFGFLMAAFLVGKLCEKQGNKASFMAFALSDMIILACGALGLSFFIGLKNAFYLGVLPFLIGSLLKILFSIMTLSGSKKIIGFFKEKKAS